MTQALLPPTKLGIDDLCRLTGLTRRTVRFYIQKGLLDKPFGEKKGAWYSQEHLERLVRIRQLSASGLSLDAVARQLDDSADGGGNASVALPGAVTVKSHITVARGIEIVVSPEQAQMRPEQLRLFIRLLAEAYQEAVQDDQPTSN
jgi:DNA-binding transcriptional MerR regulator